MKKFCVLSILLLLTACCYSQDYRKNRKEAEKYKADAGYYCGDSGECKNLKKADDAALNSLLETISNVSGRGISTAGVTSSSRS